MCGSDFWKTEDFRKRYIMIKRVKKYTNKEIKTVLLSIGLKWISGKYKNNKSIIKTKCIECKNIRETNLSSIRKHPNCLFCIGYRNTD